MELDPRTAALLQVVQGLGLPVGVTSTYRSPAHNAAVGGASGSQHTHARAIDLDVSKLNDDQKTVLLHAAVANGARGIGIYPSGNSLHLDTRDAPAVWGMLPGSPYKGMPLSYAPSWAQNPLSTLFGGASPGPAPDTSLVPRRVQTLPADTLSGGPSLPIPGLLSPGP